MAFPSKNGRGTPFPASPLNLTTVAPATFRLLKIRSHFADPEYSAVHGSLPHISAGPVADLGEGQGGRPPPGSESGPKWAPLGPLE